jgi:hypothetical protein
MYKYLYTSKIRIQRGFAKKKARFEVCGNVCSGKQFFNGEQKISSSDTIAASNLKKKCPRSHQKSFKVVLLLCTKIYISRYTVQHQSIGLRIISLLKDEILEGFTNNLWWLKTNCCSIRNSSKFKEGF